MPGADGIHSKVRLPIVGKHLPGVRSGHSAYRFLIDGDKLRADPELAFLVEGGNIASFVAQDRRIVCYACRNRQLLNVVAILPDALLFEESVASWNVRGSIDDMLKSFSEFHPTIKRIFRFLCSLSLLIRSYATETTLWQLRDQDPIGTWTKGKLILIGDAAHAMLPRITPLAT
jgi:salicylate hydroxylase